MSITFPAAHSGRCGNCNEIFPPGADVFYDSGDLLLAADCCADADTSGRTASEVTPADKVMPRGKSAADKCGTCFQIPSSNGVCGCF